MTCAPHCTSACPHHVSRRSTNRLRRWSNPAGDWPFPWQTISHSGIHFFKTISSQRPYLRCTGQPIVTTRPEVPSSRRGPPQYPAYVAELFGQRKAPSAWLFCPVGPTDGQRERLDPLQTITAPETVDSLALVELIEIAKRATRPRDWELLIRIARDGMTQSELAGEHGCSRERIRQRVERGAREAREAIQERR
jgi:hypothetical protein